MPHRHHSIDYLEFTVSDMAESKEFYGKAFGWEFTDYHPSYAGIQGQGKEMGGFAVGTPTPGGALVVLYSDDLEKTLAAVKDAGGSISKELFNFPGGRRFQFLDPNGLELAVWTTS